MLQSAIRYGIITGLVITIYSALLYFLGPEVFSNFWLYLLSAVLVIFFMVFFTIKIRKGVMGGILTFGQAFVSSFVIAAIASLVTMIWGLLLFEVIDPDLKTTMPEIILSKTEQMMTDWGVPEDQIEEQLKEQAIEMPKQFTLAGQLTGLLKGLVFYGVIALIVGAVTKKTKSSSGTDTL